ncbi:unnamed protein product [Thelazia callipaeda]|uniref:BTB domain-containing protein n=1 Tax=Thelazia callipaeda TaxID=103827 RepID=A0A158RBY9_THECL|nr:unnamed protein product [Thelazia callipaeda]
MDDSDFVVESLKTTRRNKCKSESEKDVEPENSNDFFLPDSEKDKCFNLKCLDDVRKSLHINYCLDQQEARKKYEEKKEKWNKVVDCPICGEPLEQGPFRAAHVKRCGRKHRVNPNSLLLLLDTQGKVTEVKKEKGVIHTKLKEPKLQPSKRPARFIGEPRTAFEEDIQLSTAISASMSSDKSELFMDSQKPPKLRLRKQRPRSFSFVELEPRACKCAVIEKIQENFLNIFKTQDGKQDIRSELKANIQKTEDTLKDIGVSLRKLNCLEQLADDLTRFAESNNDITVFSRENETFLTSRFIIAARAPALLQLLDSNDFLPLREYSAAAIRCYLCFLTSASIIWTESELEELYSMAKKYGPPGLAAVCKSTLLTKSSDRKTLGRQSGTCVNDKHDNCNIDSGDDAKEDEKKANHCSLAVSIQNKNEKMDKSDSSSVILLEESLQPAETMKHACITSQKLSKNLSVLKSDRFLSFESDAYHYLLPKKSDLSREKDILNTNISSRNTSPLLEDETSNKFHCSSPIPSVSRGPDNMNDLNDSIESLLRKLSPIKPSYTPKCGSQLAYCPESICPESPLANNLLNNSPPQDIRRVITPEFSFISNGQLSPLSLLDGASSNANISSPSKRKKEQLDTIANNPSTSETFASHIVHRIEDLGSNVKIVKTKNVTPMRNYDSMNDKQLKIELAKFGVRPMGKKRGVALLKKIYEETHPILENKAVSKRKKAPSLSNHCDENENLEHSSDEDCDGEKTLNKSLNEFDIIEESCVDEELSTDLPKASDLEGMQSVFLQWLRKEENSALYNQLLGLNVISFDDLVNRLSLADSLVSQIPKKTLIEILDRLHITFKMPVDGWVRRRKRGKK